jgi:hypothetical protein
MDNVHDKAEAVLAYALDALAFVRYCGDLECEGTTDHPCPEIFPDDHDEWCWPCRAWMVMQQGDWR